MNFEKIDIYGFKSFADKVEIKFEPGITAIVGPNGCGKSNVADSIRFVMGEQSAKQMRGSSMLDVIFNGTEKRKAQSYCEVSLFFDNSQKIFNLDYEKVILTRKLYKSGESEYSINKNVCRRRDIIDAFRDIGLGKESYSVIGQGKIDSILSAKPEDRRHVFEEAAGISKFKEERSSSENKLANVNDNLTRINDILSELEKQIGPLKNQAENAKIFVELSNRLKELEISIYVYGYENSSSEKQKINEVIASIDEELALRQTEFESATREYELSQTQIEKLDDSINELRNELLNLSVALEKQNGEVRLIDQKISILKEQNEKLIGQIEQGKFLQESNQKETEKLQNDKKTSENYILNLENELKSLEMNFNTTMEKLNLGVVNVQSSDEEFYSVIEKQGDIKSSLLKYQTELESLKEKSASLTKDKESLDNEQQELSKKSEAIKKEIAVLSAMIETKLTERRDLVNEINNINAEINNASENIEEKKAKYHTDLSKLNVLTEMKEYNEGFMIGVKRLLEQAKTGSSVGGKVIGVVASLMKVPEKYEVAIEMALGSSVQNIVTKNEDDAKGLIDYLKTNKFGRVTFLPITSVKTRDIPSFAATKLNMNGILGIASELISYDENYSAVFKSLLGATVIADNLDNATAFARATSFSVRVVTLDGDIISTAGSMTGGSRKENASGLIGRDREIEELKNKLTELKEDITGLEQSYSSLKNEQIKKSDELSKKIDEIHEYEMNKAKQEEILSAYEAQSDELATNISEARVNLSVNQDKIDFVQRQIELILKESENVSAAKSQASESKRQANDDFGKLRLVRDELFAQIGDIRLKIESEKNNLGVIERSLERIFVSSAENEYRTKETLLEVQRNNQEIDNYNQKISEIMTNSEFSAEGKKVDAVSEQISKLTTEKKIAQQKMNEADGNKMILAGEIQRARDRRAKEENAIVKIDSDLENMQNRVWEEYQMTYGDAKEKAIPDFNIKEGSAECAEVKRKIQRLGNVNLSAIEDIKTVSERYDDLSRQRDDLVKAQEDLRLIIKNLTETMEVKFNSCFEEIRQNFRVIFKELFGGGKADICLDDEKNPLECGIEVIAEPPGKKLQSITLLSGGEKALTAVAILFSILKLRPMPFCVLDEIEAALDDANVERYAKYLHRYSGDTQFIVITHRKPTMELADALYGVTMEEKGVSKVVSVKLSDAIKLDNGEM